MVGGGLQVDTMIVQAIGLLDDLDKELNTYAMRVREWYGWHFPEMTRVVTDNIQYALAVGLLIVCCAYVDPPAGVKQRSAHLCSMARCTRIWKPST